MDYGFYLKAKNTIYFSIKWKSVLEEIKDLYVTIQRRAMGLKRQDR